MLTLQGVVFVGLTGPDKLRHFHAAQAVITATDGSGNVATAICR